MDHTIYDMPDEIVLQLSLKDVNLGSFKDIKNDVLALRAGQKLRCDGENLYDKQTNKSIGKLSKKIMSELSGWNERIIPYRMFQFVLL